MAGQLTIDTLKASSGVLATQNGMTGIAKAWCLYNGTTQTIIGSFNISSVTYNSTGDYSFNFTTALPSNTASVVCMGTHDSGGYVTQPFLDNDNTPITTSRVRVNCLSTNALVFTNGSYIYISLFI